MLHLNTTYSGVPSEPGPTAWLEQAETKLRGCNWPKPSWVAVAAAHPTEDALLLGSTLAVPSGENWQPGIRYGNSVGISENKVL